MKRQIIAGKSSFARRVIPLAAVLLALLLPAGCGLEKPGTGENPAAGQPSASDPAVVSRPEAAVQPDRVQITETVFSDTTVTVSWNAVAEAEGYEISVERSRMGADAGSDTELSETAERSFTADFQGASLLRLQVRAWKTADGQRLYGEWSDFVEGEGPLPQGDFTYAELEKLEFTFASGAGAWSTELYVAADGSFTGLYHDADMGDTGEGYPNGTQYYCRFSGSFAPPVYVDEYTYAAPIRQLLTEEEPEQVEIIDGVRWISSVPYGLENTEEVLFYLPGKPVSELPEEYVSWCRYELFEEETLPFYGLYNQADGYGFSSAQVVFDRDDLVKLFRETAQRSAEIDAAFERGDMDQSTMNSTAAERYYLWDGLLNRMWDYFKETLPEDEMKSLTAQQVKWIAEKEAAVKAAGAEVEGGSMQPLAEYGVAAEYTEARVREWLETYFA